MKDAEKALECNGMAVRAGMADGLVMVSRRRRKCGEKRRRGSYQSGR